jgi:hypothetical protein
MKTLRTLARSRTPFALSLAIHAVAAMALGAITFRVPLSAFLRPRVEPPVVTRVVFVRVAPPSPRAIPKPTVTPPVSSMPPASTADADAIVGPPSRISATVAAGPVGVTRLPKSLRAPDDLPRFDPRLSFGPAPALPKSVARQLDSTVTAAYTKYRDSVGALAANPARASADSAWTTACPKWLLGVRHCAAALIHTRSDGRRIGWDEDGLHFGKFSIPIGFGATSVSLGGNVNGLTNARMNAWTKRDLSEHAQVMTGDDVREAVARIRQRLAEERKDIAKPILTTPAKPPG